MAPEHDQRVSFQRSATSAPHLAPATSAAAPSSISAIVDMSGNPLVHATGAAPRMPPHHQLTLAVGPRTFGPPANNRDGTPVPRLLPICGGDVHHCLSDGDLNRLNGPALGKHHLQVRLYHDARNSSGNELAIALANMIVRAVHELGFIHLTVHERQHWLTANITRRYAQLAIAGPGETIDKGDISLRETDKCDLCIVIYDSAKSHQITRDVRKMFVGRMGMPEPQVISHAKQPRGSYECGLHVVMIAMSNFMASKARKELPRFQESHETIELAAWRPILADLSGGWDETTIMRLCKITKRAREFILPPHIDDALGHPFAMRQNDPYAGNVFARVPAHGGAPATQHGGHTALSATAAPFAPCVIRSDAGNPTTAAAQQRGAVMDYPDGRSHLALKGIKKHKRPVAASTSNDAGTQTQIVAGTDVERMTLSKNGKWSSLPNSSGQNVCWANATLFMLSTVQGCTPRPSEYVNTARRLGYNGETTHSRRGQRVRSMADASEALSSLWEYLPGSMTDALGVTTTHTQTSVCSCRGGKVAASGSTVGAGITIPAEGTVNGALRSAVRSTTSGKEACTNGCGDALSTTVNSYAPLGDHVLIAVMREHQANGATSIAVSEVLTVAPFKGWTLAGATLFRGAHYRGARCDDGAWSIGNDSKVSPCNVSDVLLAAGGEASMLMYRRPKVAPRAVAVTAPRAVAPPTATAPPAAVQPVAERASTTLAAVTTTLAAVTTHRYQEGKALLDSSAKHKLGEGMICIVQRDIADTAKQLRAKFCLNAANKRLSKGGGVCGAIHNAAGTEMARACSRLPDVAAGVKCEPGSCVATPSFRMSPDGFTLHAVAPDVRGRFPDNKDIRDCLGAYRQAFAAARACGLASGDTIVLCVLGTGIFEWPVVSAVRTMLEAVKLERLHNIGVTLVIACTDEEVVTMLRRELRNPVPPCIAPTQQQQRHQQPQGQQPACVTERPHVEEDYALPRAPTESFVLDVLKSVDSSNGGPIGHGIVKKLISGMEVGDWLLVDWSTSKDCSGRLVGQLTRHATVGLNAQVRYTAELCDGHDCPNVHPLTEPYDNYLPSRGVNILQVILLRGPPPTEDMCTACEEDDVDSDVGSDAGDEVPITAKDADRLKQLAADCMPKVVPPRSAMGKPRGDKRVPILRDSEYLEQLGPQLPGTPSLTAPRGTIARAWYVFNGRPPHVHKGVWGAKAAATRARGSRWIKWISTLPDDVAKLPLPQAVIEGLLRDAQRKRWSWTTVASYLSAIKSALKFLPLYTNAVMGIDIGSDVGYAEICRLAQSKARVKSLDPAKSAPITQEQLDSVAKRGKDPAAWALAQLSWFLAARVGDARRLHANDIEFDFKKETAGQVPMTVRFTEGKIVTYCGPYHIHATMPTAIAKAVHQHIAEADTGDGHIFSFAAQKRLSARVAEVHNCSLRSIRKGALVWMAQLGATDRQLQLLSGHKRTATLDRYLEWSKRSGEASKAALDRARLQSDEGKKSNTKNRSKRNITGGALKMGSHSGYVGDKGRRTPPRPRSLPSSPPSCAALGIKALGPEVNVQDLPLHAHPDVQAVDMWPSLYNMVDSPDLRGAVGMVHSFVLSGEHYGVSGVPLVTKQLPLSSFQSHDVRRLLEVGKIATHPRDMPILAYVKGFWVLQTAKQRRRPIFEPSYNRTMNKDARPSQTYPARLERRLGIAGKRFRMFFDFKAWFDQIALEDDAKPYHVMRIREPIEIDGEMHDTFVLTREPMGAGHSAHVGQTVTWAVCEPIIKMPSIHVSSMIDNVEFSSNNEKDFVDAVIKFLERCDKIGLILNDRNTYPVNRKAIAKMGRDNAASCVYLGEEYVGSKIRNTKNNVDKLSASYGRLQQSLDDQSIVVTRRHVASTIGLCSWMAGTTQQHMNQHFDLMRTMSKLETTTCDWDEQCSVTPRMLNDIHGLAGTLIKNEAVDVIGHLPPSCDMNHYDVVIIMDASATGWGAYIFFTKTGQMHQLRCGWRKEIPASAWAEPLAATECIHWARAQLGADIGIAIVTDHEAMATGQRRWWSGNAGFSSAFHLNEFFRVLYDGSPRADVWHVPGVDNPTDGISRCNQIGEPLKTCQVADVLMPALSTFHHPFLVQPERPWWNV